MAALGLSRSPLSPAPLDPYASQSTLWLGPSQLHCSVGTPVTSTGKLDLNLSVSHAWASSLQGGGVGRKAATLWNQHRQLRGRCQRATEMEGRR